MARVILFQGGNIQPEGATRARVQAADFSANPIAEGLKQIGGAGSDYAEREAQLQSIHDEATVKEAANGVAKYFSELGYTGPNAYFQKQGKDALLDRPNVEKALDTYIQQGKAGLKTDRQRELFDLAVTPQRTAWGVEIANHADKETTTYAVNESAARATTAGELAKQTFITDPAHADEQVATGLSEFNARAKLEGWGPERLAVEKLKFTSGIYKDIGSSLAYQGADGPKLAQGVIDKYGSVMTGDDRQAVLDHSRVAQNALEAEQRRLEAEAHRQEREAKSDARDRAESVARMIQDGSVVDPKRLASAMSDAQVAGDDGLVETLRQGGMKNNLTQEYAGATPAELQNKVNELSAEITKAGGKVDPDKIVERDHLQTLLSNSRSQLRSDPLAWGAEHLGLNVVPLNLSDPNSINDRINIAATIARRTGTTPKPLTQDEVAVTQQTLQNGTTEQKVALAMRLAKLGPLALPAAEQLTNDAGFQSLIGLATNANRGVAASRVNQVLTGFDVLKTKPKLIDPNQARPQFDQYVGGALQFLPQVKAGVLKNAQALLATQANEHGWNEWKDIDGRAWFRAVNSALGAYTRDGKQVGGLASYNGAVTVLPENMSLDEFESRIAKSHGPEFRKAQNGEPVFADGRTPTATDLKRMQWVPSGDGIYRITDGNGFLKSKSGGFYEIDVNKLSPLDAELASHGYVRY